MFTRSLIRSEKEMEYSESNARLFIDFLIDEAMNIFNIPDDLQADIDSGLVWNILLGYLLVNNSSFFLR